ncbi:PREDICTED: uncharacterized protein LOC108565754 isoform X2 [Nicrophorus vespilloides]|uniref:Uncharacterized protein LOC108565754 isoform X2 n=1 Tax=Nicrophorus vespilloides TaxID=110193 RepID=A0ABM1N1Z2_NICVS|nr:PREDICTED: uncharacterized protein LOC108565754 isoform X2 [Nicrophorus vespilloides]
MMYKAMMYKLKKKKNISQTGTAQYLKNNGFIVTVSSIMATDSPTPDHSDHINYSADSGRMTPPPTTSYSKPEVVVDSSLAVEPTKDDKDKDESDFSRPDANPDSNPEKVDSGKDKGNSKSSDGGAAFIDKNKEDGKLNGGDSRLENKWIPPPALVDDKDDSEEKDCAVNCIYYTLQCCECTIT